MTALLEVPAIRQRFSPLSVAEYHQLGEFNEHGRRTELICGIVIEKMSKSPLHYDTIEAIREILEGQIQPGHVIRQEGPLTLGDSEPEPDIAVVRGARGDFRTVHPAKAELVIEVAVSSLEIDRAKARIYAEAGVREYWIVCPGEKRVEVYRQPLGQGFAETVSVAAPASLASTALPEVRLDLAVLFA